MARPMVLLTLVAGQDLAGELADGGLLVAGCAVPLYAHCELVVRGGEHELRLAARVAALDPDGAARLDLTAEGAELGRNLADLARLADAVSASASAVPPVVEHGAPAPATGEEPVPVIEGEPAVRGDGEPAATGDGEPAASDEERRLARNVQERLRHLTLAAQIRVAQKGLVHERIVLERMYGKTVWEALLRNPAITGPEVARIARMGALPRPLIEIIVGNGGWLQLAEVRRALLSNPRLGVDQIVRVLRLLPRVELKLAAVQTAYPHPVRDAARRLLRDE